MNKKGGTFNSMSYYFIIPDEVISASDFLKSEKLLLSILEYSAPLIEPRAINANPVTAKSKKNS